MTPAGTAAAAACVPHINTIGTALAGHDIHQQFIGWAAERLEDGRERAIFRRMARRAGIEHRWSVLSAGDLGRKPSARGEEDFLAGSAPASFYGVEAATPTRQRMETYARFAPRLALDAIAGVGDLAGVTHIVVASCTGFVAPGIDQILARELGLAGSVERTVIGFMGCYAAVTALRNAWHIVRSQPGARVLVVTVELCSLHLQPDATLEQLLAMMLFGDGAAAAIVSAEPTGLEMSDPFAIALPDSGTLITWRIGDHGFAMELSGEVPAHLVAALRDEAVRERLGGGTPVDSWAVHAGGRSILDAVETGLGLGPHALDTSRGVLEDCGNMSSSTLMFVLSRILGSDDEIANGRAVAFGPGLAAEGFGYRRAA